MASEIRDLTKQEKQLRNTIEGIRRFVLKFKPEEHQNQVETRVEMLDAAMKKFYVIRRKLELLIEEADETETSDTKETKQDRAARLEALADERDEENAEVARYAEDVYCELKSSLQRLRLKQVESLSEAPATQTHPTSSALSRVKLPEIRLPSFGGRLRVWVTFRDMFQSLIHRNDQLTDMDRFSYL